MLAHEAALAFESCHQAKEEGYPMNSAFDHKRVLALASVDFQFLCLDLPLHTAGGTLQIIASACTCLGRPWHHIHLSSQQPTEKTVRSQANAESKKHICLQLEMDQSLTETV